MKKIIGVGVFTLAAALSFNANAWNIKDGTTCAQKEEVIKQQIQYAEKYGNSHKVNGLEKALENVKRYCTNDALESEYKEDIQEKLEDIEELKQEIQEAKLKGKADKVAKKEYKLQEKQTELAELQNQLEDFYKLVK